MLFRSRMAASNGKRLIARLRELGVHTPVIGFPRGAGALATDYAAEAAPDAVALGTGADSGTAYMIQASRPIQGALDPLLLRAGGPLLDARVDFFLSEWGADGRYIFNLGHGILPDTPIAHVEQVLKRITGA